MRTYVQKTCVWQPAPPRASMHATRIAYVHRLVATVATVAPTQQLTTHLHTRTTTATTTTYRYNNNNKQKQQQLPVQRIQLAPVPVAHGVDKPF